MSFYLVTGGAGFIGSHIVDALVKQGEKVRVLDNFCEGTKENLAESIEKIELIEGDIRDVDTLKKWCENVDFILHQAALRSVARSVEEPALYNEVNVTGTMNVLLAARQAGVKRVVFASSSSVFGDTTKFPNREDDFPRPISPYAASKMAGEIYCRVFSCLYGLETVALRYFNVYGPRQNPASEYAAVIPRFVTRMLKDEPPVIDGNGKQSRDFTYVSNVVDANLLSAVTEGVSPEVFNISCGKDYSVLQIVKYLNKIMGKKIKPEFGPARSGDVKRTLSDISKAKRLMHYTPAVDFNTGLKKCVEWFSENYKS